MLPLTSRIDDTVCSIAADDSPTPRASSVPASFAARRLVPASPDASRACATAPSWARSAASTRSWRSAISSTAGASAAMPAARWRESISASTTSSTAATPATSSAPCSVARCARSSAADRRYPIEHAKAAAAASAATTINTISSELMAPTPSGPDRPLLFVVSVDEYLDLTVFGAAQKRYVHELRPEREAEHEVEGLRALARLGREALEPALELLDGRARGDVGEEVSPQHAVFGEPRQLGLIGVVLRDRPVRIERDQPERQGVDLAFRDVEDLLRAGDVHAALLRDGAATPRRRTRFPWQPSARRRSSFSAAAAAWSAWRAGRSSRSTRPWSRGSQPG